MKRKMVFHSGIVSLSFILFFSSCHILTDQMHYPELKKVAARTQERFDSVVDIYFPETVQQNDTILEKNSNSTTDISLNESAIYPRLLKKVRQSNEISGLVENYRSKGDLIEYYKFKFRKHASLSEVKIAKVWKLIITLALIVLLIFITIFVAELTAGSESCLGCGLGMGLVLLTILLIYGFFDILTS